MMNIRQIVKSLNKEEKKSICEKLGIACERLELLINAKKIPLGILYLIMKMRGKIDYKKLLDLSIWGLTRDLTLDEDGWGARRAHKRVLGMFAHLGNEQLQLELEKSLKSTLSLSWEEKCYFIDAAKQMSLSQLLSFITAVEDEMKSIERELFFGQVSSLVTNEKLQEKITRNKKEWEKVEAYFKSKELVVERDSEQVLYPVALQKRLQEYVKGQEEALYSIATSLYYQKKISNAFMQEKHPPFEPLKPLLLSGETGSGKSYIVQKACEIMDIPFVYIDASTMVSTGIRGLSVDEIAKTLLRKYEYDPKKVQGAVVVLDEIDKLMQTTYGESVMSQILRILEGGEIFIEKGLHEESKEFKGINYLSTKHMFFVLAGSFQFHKDEKKSGFLSGGENYEQEYLQAIEKSGLPKELLGRIGDIVVLNPLGEKELLDILLHSKDSPIKRYQKMLKSSGMPYKVSKEEAQKMAKEAARLPYGARSLEKIVLAHFKDKLFRVHHQDVGRSSYDILLERIKSSL